MQVPVPLVAMPADAATRRRIRSSLLVHAAPREAVSGIVEARQRDPGRFGTWQVVLRSGQGWAPGRWTRDYSVADRPFGMGDEARDYGHYIYFFAGEPGFWGRFKNLTPPDFLLAPWKLFGGGEALLTRYVFLTVRGDEVVSEQAPLFWRSDDRCVVLRAREVRCGAEIRPQECPGMPV